MLFIWFKIVSLFVLFSSKIIIFDENKTNKLTILNHINNIYISPEMYYFLAF